MTALNGKLETSVLESKRGEIWLVRLDPSLGAEIRKTRPVVVVNSDAIGVLPIRLVAPLTKWKDYFTHNIWHVRVMPDSANGLSKPSAIDALQLRGVDTQRFVRRIGNVSEAVMRSIVRAIAEIIEP
jgi:mRNA interferase MazF